MNSVVGEADNVFLPRSKFVRCTDHANSEFASSSKNVSHINTLAAEFVLRIATGVRMAP